MSALKRPMLGALEEAMAHAVQLQGHVDRGEAVTPTEQRLLACAGEVQGLLRLLRLLGLLRDDSAGFNSEHVAEAVRLINAKPQAFVDAYGNDPVRVVTDALGQLQSEKDKAYTERNAVVAALSKLYPSYLALHPDDPEWDAEWRAIVFVETPAGQLSWHLHDSHMQMFRHLPWKENRWDGHTTEQKYQRLAAL